MDLRTIVEHVILEYANVPYAYEPELCQFPVFDRERGHYLVVVAGWGLERERVHYCLLHVTIHGDSVRIEHDGTEDGLAGDLERAGLSKDRIVLAFLRPEARAYNGYGVAFTATP